MNTSYYHSGHFHTTSGKKKRYHLELNLFQNLNYSHLNFAGRRDQFMDQSKLKPIQCWKLHNIQIMDYSEVRSFFVPVKICSSLVDSPDLCVPMENDKPLTLKLYSPITAYKKYGTVPFMSV